MGSDADMEDYGFEYSEEEPEEQDVDIENQYYNSKGLVETDPEGALAGFAEVVHMEPEKAEWGFKALKQTVKLYYRLGRYKEMMEAYRVMLSYIKSAVTRNYSEKCINNIMDFVSGSASQNFGLLQEFYQTTLKALEEAKNERLWFKTNLKLCKIWFDMGEYGRMNKILKELHKSCRREDGTDDQKKGTQLLEVYAIEIQMYTETKNNKKLKQLYQKALSIKSAIPHPRIMGIIHECGGKMHMAERQWADAATDFFEAFKNYDEAGNQRRIQCLKYLVLANMLMESEVNPFDGQEAKPYKNDPEILAMTNLIAAYQRNEILEFEKILKSNRRTIMDDPFIRNYIEDLLKNIRTQVLLKLIKPYTRIRIPFISKELNVPEKDVEQLLVSLILDNRIQGHIDQVNRLLERGDRSKGMKKYAAIEKWNTQLSRNNSPLNVPSGRHGEGEEVSLVGEIKHSFTSFEAHLFLTPLYTGCLVPPAPASDFFKSGNVSDSLQNGREDCSIDKSFHVFHGFGDCCDNCHQSWKEGSCRACTVTPQLS
ncbi:hypothetical protein NE237_003901 [Protea cynaroides]|uniref:COP9 signalosome complex subunit 2 n=1 Tax=Protea cynaroides TaxID=273540 RepID=A0A9Q0KHV7_9MAGN|nr:hypothetical protein NE237_003901 [Protea cynaroides]